MGRFGPGARVVVPVMIGALLFGSGLAPNARAAGPDGSEVVLVLDFSASILRDTANRNRFGAALERIADRVDAISADLIAGDATVSIVQFATKAADYPGCADLKLLDNGPNVARFANCLRSVAAAYRKGLTKALTRKIGVDTNYVAAMEAAARHLPADAVRPALILLTDGKHDVKGVPASSVGSARNRLFASRTPFALLPVGMGLKPKQRGALESGLAALRVIKDMPACISGAAFEWPRVVFDTADEAGNAVAVALQDVTCTFTVEPTPTPEPTPAPQIGVVRNVRLAAGDGQIDVSWLPPVTTPEPIVDYRTRCRADGDWIESSEGVSLETRATVAGLANGTAYQCEVAIVGTSVEGSWTGATTTATPTGRPAAPPKPAVEALDAGVQLSVPRDESGLASEYHFECSGDNGSTWPAEVDILSAERPTGKIGNLTNGEPYVCRAFAVNDTGTSDPSPVSDTFRPCGSFLECNPLLAPILGILGVLMAAGVLAVLLALYRGRTRGYVVAVVDVVHSTNLGHGSRLGITFEREPTTRRVTGIAADRSPKADIRIRQLRGGRFEVTDRTGTRICESGEAVIAADSVGARHEIVLRAFDTNTAAAEQIRS